MAFTRRSLLGNAVVGKTALAAMPSGAAAFGLGANLTPSAPAADQVNVLFWHTQTGSNQRALDELVASFNTSNGKGLSLRAEYQGNYTQVYQKTMASLAAGTPPDTAVAYESMVADYTRANAVVNLDDYLRAGPAPLSAASIDDYFPSYLESNRYSQFGGKLLSFPFTKSLAVNYFNQDAIAQAGIDSPAVVDTGTFKQIVSGATARNDDGTAATYGTNITIDASYIDAFIYANGGALISDDGARVRFDELPAIDVFETWRQFMREGTAYVARGFDFQPDFGHGKVANVQQSSTGMPYFKQEVESGAQFTWGIGLPPQADPLNPVTVLFGGNVTVFKTVAAKQAACWEWLKFFTGREQSAAWAVRSAYMPLRKSCADLPLLQRYWQELPQAKQAFDLANYARPEPNVSAWQDIRSALEDALTSVVKQQAAAATALREAAVLANNMLAAART